jgi:hypothetical protein
MVLPRKKFGGNPIYKSCPIHLTEPSFTVYSPPMKILLLAAMLLQAPLSVREWRVAHEHEILDEFADLLRVPNVSRNLNDIRATATLIENMYRRRGIGSRP